MVVCGCGIGQLMFEASFNFYAFALVRHFSRLVYFRKRKRNNMLMMQAWCITTGDWKKRNYVKSNPPLSSSH